MYWYIVTQVIDNTVEGCLLHHLLEYEKEVPTNRELFETYFITIRYLRKEVTYGNKYSREHFTNNLRERLYFIYDVAKIQQAEDTFLETGENI